MIRVCGVGTILGILLSGMIGCSDRREESNQLMGEALEAARSNDHATAKSKLQLALLKDPTNAAAYHNRAAIFAKEGEMEAAILDFEKAVEYDKGNAQWRYELAGQYWAVYQRTNGVGTEGYLAKMDDQLSKAIESSPSVADYYLMRGRCRRESNAFRGAVADFHKTIELDPLQAEAYLELGRIYGLMAQVFHRDDLFALAAETLGAADGLGKLAELTGDKQVFLVNMSFELGRLFLWRARVETEEATQQDFRDKAISRFIAIVEAFTPRGLVYLQLAQAYQMSGDTNKACSAAELALNGLPPEDELLREQVTNFSKEVCMTATGIDANR